MQAISQELVRALFSDIESNSDSKTLSGKLFQRWVIDIECLEQIVQADSEQKANAVLAIHLYRIGTEEALQDYVDVLKESGLPRPKGLGERIEAALVEARALETFDMEVNWITYSGHGTSVHDFEIAGELTLTHELYTVCSLYFSFKLLICSFAWHCNDYSLKVQHAAYKSATYMHVYCNHHYIHMVVHNYSYNSYLAV